MFNQKKEISKESAMKCLQLWGFGHCAWFPVLDSKMWKAMMTPANYESNCLMGEFSVLINFVNNKITFHSVCFLYTNKLLSIKAVEVQYKKNSIFNIVLGP